MSRSIFVIFGVDVDEPGIKPLNAKSGACGEQASSNGMVLVIILEHTGPADWQ